MPLIGCKKLDGDASEAVNGVGSVYLQAYTVESSLHATDGHREWLLLEVCWLRLSRHEARRFVVSCICSRP